MSDKFFNNAIVGNNNIVASFTKNGELQRLCFPQIDGRQFIDFFHTGVKVNNSDIIYLHQDINNKYSQKYVENTNVLVTNIENTYFNLKIEQVDCIMIEKNILIKKYKLKNMSDIDLDVKFIVNSKILSNILENFGSRIIDNGIIQYNYNYALSIFSNKNIYGHKLNDVGSVIQKADLYDKDYIGMSNEIAISYNLGIINPKQEIDFDLFVTVDNNNNVQEKIEENLKIKSNIEIQKVEDYWKSYVEKHSKFNIKTDNSNYLKKIYEIYNRSILLFPILVNHDTGGIAAALETDENRAKSGGYTYCWPRDSIFITTAFDLLHMEKETELFYNNFCRKTQSDNGMWEQRFFTDGTLAPCWGYQIDETASVVFGIYNHFKYTNNKEFLVQNLKTCEKAISFLMEYVENILEIEETDIVKQELKNKYKKNFEIHKHVSYDLWEMNEGIHLYSLSSIIAAFESMINIYENIDIKSDNAVRLRAEKRNNIIEKLKTYISLLKAYIKNNLVDNELMTLKRNTNDNNMDISIIGAIYPFRVFDPNEKIVKNTIDKINMTLRTYTGGYLRFENDNYMGGNNPWVITTLWMAMYFIELGDIKSAEDCFKFVVNTSSDYGLLSEQVNNEDENFKWIIGLGWSHAMFIIVLDELLKLKIK